MRSVIDFESTPGPAWPAAAPVEVMSAGDITLVVDRQAQPTTEAVAAFASAFAAHPEADLAYCDHHAAAEGRNIHKPAWSPLLQRSFPYVGPLWAARTRFLQAHLQGMGAPDIGVAFDRLATAARGVLHLPLVLCRAQQAWPAQQSADGATTCGHGSAARVSAVVPTCLADPEMLAECLTGLRERTDHTALEIVVLLNNVSDRSEPEWLAHSADQMIRVPGAFNWSTINNIGASHASGELLLFLNDDVQVTDPAWLTHLIQTLESLPKGGAVGPKLLHADRRIQSVGMHLVYHGGGAQHLFRDSGPANRDAAWLARGPREVSALGGACMLVSRQAFDAVGGFDEQFALVNNDVDFCIRLAHAGFGIAVDPRAPLVHHEGVSRGNAPEMDDVLRFWARHEPVLRRGDPYWNPCLDPARTGWEALDEVAEAHRARMIACGVPA